MDVDNEGVNKKGGTPMGKQEHAILVKIKYHDRTRFYIYSKKEKRFVSLTEARLARALPGYTQLNEKARQRAFDTFIKRSEVIEAIKVPEFLPTAQPKPRLSQEERERAAQSSLSIANLFEAQRVGYTLLADILCGQHCTALRKAEPSFSPTIAIRNDSPEIQSVLKKLVKSIVRVSRWKIKKGKIERTAILNYRISPGELPHHIQDATLVKCSIPGYGKLRFPARYTDTIVLMIGADKSQIQEAVPYLDNAAVILLNCGTGDLSPTRLSSSDLAAYDPEIIQQLKANRKAVSALLGWWWSAFGNEDAWARGIVQEARASFGKPDSRYIRVELDPRQLRDAIRYRVLLSFMDALEAAGVLGSEDLQSYRQGAKDVFDPDPQETVTLRRVEDPEVFQEIMRELVAAKRDSIVAGGERFVKADKPFAAWRTISGEQYLVMPEDAWAKAYKKAALARNDLETSFFKQPNWRGDLQKILVEAEVIKRASSGYRYRYDLFGDGSRDQTYVVAISTQILEN